MNTCRNFKQLMDYEVRELRYHLSQHKYFLGEHHEYPNDRDIEMDFLETYFQKVSKEMRSTFCNKHCNVAECPIRDYFNKEKD